MTTRACFLLLGLLSLTVPTPATAQTSDLTPIAPVPPTELPTELPPIRLGAPLDNKPAPPLLTPASPPTTPALEPAPTGMPPVPPTLSERPGNNARDNITHQVLIPSARSTDIAEASPAFVNCGPTCGQSAAGCRVWGQAEYLLWWVKGANLPPLVSTSTSQASLGRLDRPDTTVLFGGTRDEEVRHGGRFALGWQMPLDDCGQEWIGLDAAYFFLNNHNNNFSAYSSGDTVLARPFTDAITGAQRIQQVANLRIGNAGAIPPDVPALAGGVAVNNPSRFWGIEGNANFHCRPGGYPPLEFFAGYRYLSLSEGVTVREDLFQPADPTGIPDNTRFVVFDSFGAANRYNGGQLGLRTEKRHGRWGMQFVGKLGMGVNHQTVDIAGYTTSTVTGSAPATGVGGLLALPTNIGRYERDRLCFVPEVNLNATYEVCRHVRCYLGYTFLYWSSVVRPGDHIDTTINTAYLPPATPTTGPTRPAFNWNATDFWAQGLNFGLELNY